MYPRNIGKLWKHTHEANNPHVPCIILLSYDITTEMRKTQNNRQRRIPGTYQVQGAAQFEATLRRAFGTRGRPSD